LRNCRIVVPFETSRSWSPSAQPSGAGGEETNDTAIRQPEIGSAVIGGIDAEDLLEGRKLLNASSKGVEIRNLRETDGGSRVAAIHARRAARCPDEQVWEVVKIEIKEPVLAAGATR
jgi:hypothetical protein